MEQGTDRLLTLLPAEVAPMPCQELGQVGAAAACDGSCELLGFMLRSCTVLSCGVEPVPGNLGEPELSLHAGNSTSLLTCPFPCPPVLLLLLLSVP